MTLESLLSEAALLRILLTLGAVGLVLAAKQLSSRWIRKGADILDEGQRKRLFYSRSALNLLLAILLLIIWMGQLQNLVLSLTAVTVAIVIATKELLMCLSGFLLRTGSHAFAVGDWVEVNGIRGEVTDHNLLSTTLLEIHDPEHGHRYTGRSLIVPNSVFLVHPVKNENFARNYCIHDFSIVTPPELEPAKACEWLLETAREACRPFEEVSRRYNAMIDRKLGVDVPGPEPEVTLRTTDLGHFEFELLIFCPTREAARLERRITLDFLESLAEGAFASPSGARDCKPSGG
jgi:small-conductance mechanosensitive channel